MRFMIDTAYTYCLPSYVLKKKKKINLAQMYIVMYIVGKVIRKNKRKKRR